MTPYPTKPGWAWEYLRRNAEFRRALGDARDGFEVVSRSDTLEIFAAHRIYDRLESFGCLFADDGDLPAGEATVFWKPEMFRGALSVVARPQGALPDTECFRLSTLRSPAVLLLFPGDRQHLLFRGEGCGLQLCIEGADVRRPVQLLARNIFGNRGSTTQISTLRCFNEFLATGKFQCAHLLNEPTSPRHRFVVTALDGWLAGKPHKEIAVTLFGNARVEEDWHNPNEHLRDRVRRAIQFGRRMMEGGYLNLLC